MPEAIMILLDNSSYSINGDYVPTRWDSQIDCAGLLIQARMEQQQQTFVGVGLMGGNQVQIICTPTNDSMKVNAYLYGIKQYGYIHFCQSLQISALALKHRADSTLKQKIIMFVASTVQDSIEQIKLIGKKLKKNGIAVDIIAIGDLSTEQNKKLSALHEAVNHEENSSLKMIQPTNNYLSDSLIGSSIFGGNDINSNMINEQQDEQLAMALKMSLQQVQNNNPPMEQQKDDQQELERKALQLSLQDNNQKHQKPKEQKDKKQ